MLLHQSISAILSCYKTTPPPRIIEMSAMRALFVGVAALLLLAVPMEQARAQDEAPRAHLLNIDFWAASGDPVAQLGDRITVTLRFFPAVRVTGVPYITLDIGSSKRRANFYISAVSAERERSNLNFSDLKFIYPIQASDRDTDGVTIDAAASITLNGGTIKSVDGNRDANLHIRTQSYSRDPVKVDGSDRTYANLPHWWRTNVVNFPKSGDTYKRGEEILVEVLCSPAVTVTGTPQFGISIGERVRYANYDAARSRGDRLIFSYVVQASDIDGDGIRRAGFITLNGGRIVIQGSTAPIELGDGYVPSDFI